MLIGDVVFSDSGGNGLTRFQREGAIVLKLRLKLTQECRDTHDDAQREVGSNIAGFLGFVTYKQAVFIGATHCLKITFADAVSLHTVLNVLPNPASP